MKIPGLLVALTGAALLAQPVRADPAYDRCIKAADGSNTAWEACGSAWVQREDDRLNAAWKRVASGLEGKTRTDLLEEQRAWIAFMEKSCLFHANGDWGREGQVLEFPACRARVIAARTAALRTYEAFFSK